MLDQQTRADIPERQTPDSIGPYRIKRNDPETKHGLLAVGGEAHILVAVLEDPRLPQPVKRHIEFIIKQARQDISGASEKVEMQGLWQMLLSGSENPHVEKVLTVMPAEAETPARYVMRRADSDLDTYLERSLQHEEDFKKRCFIAASVALQMAKALDGVQKLAKKHGYREAEVVHRDIKPANVLLRMTESDVPFVTITDFNGIAGREAALKQSLSMSGTEGTREMETLRYMSPEQEMILYGRRDRDQIDLRSDIFSLGLVLIELIGGNHGRRSIDIPEDTNPALKGIIKKCTAENPEQRFPTPEDLVIALEQLTNTMQGRAVTGPGQKLVSTNDLESLREADATQLTPEQAAAQGALGRMKGRELLQLAASLGLTTAMGVLATVLGGFGTVAGALGGKLVESVNKEYERRKMVKAILDAMTEQYPQEQLLAKIIEAVKANRDMTPARRDEVLSGTVLQQLDPEKMQEQIKAAVESAMSGKASSKDLSGIAGLVEKAVKKALEENMPRLAQKPERTEIIPTKAGKRFLSILVEASNKYSGNQELPAVIRQNNAGENIKDAAIQIIADLYDNSTSAVLLVKRAVNLGGKMPAYNKDAQSFWQEVWKVCAREDAIDTLITWVQEHPERCPQQSIATMGPVFDVLCRYVANMEEMRDLIQKTGEGQYLPHLAQTGSAHHMWRKVYDDASNGANIHFSKPLTELIKNIKSL